MINKKGVVDEDAVRILTLSYLAERKGPMRQIATRFLVAEIQNKFGEYFGKDLYNKSGGIMRILEIENRRIKIFYKKDAAKDKTGKFKIISPEKLNSLMSEYSEEKPGADPEEKQGEIPKIVVAPPEEEKSIKKEPLEELDSQGEAMEVFIESNTDKKGTKKKSVVAEELDPQGQAMEAFINGNTKGGYIEGSEDKAEELAENMPGDKIMSDEEIEQKEADKLKELQETVAQARMDYSKKNYELTSVFTRLKQFFGKNLTSEHNNIHEENQLLGEYKKALNDLLAYEVEGLKDRNLSPEELNSEMEKLTRYYNQDEKVNLYESRTEARAQVIEKKLGRAGRPVGWVMSGAKKFFHWYEKSEGQGVKGFSKGIMKRGSFNAALTAAGLGISAITLPAAAVGVTLAQRALGATVAGVGATRFLEGRYRKGENKKMAEERKGIMAEIGQETDPEKKLAKLLEKMNLETDGYDNDLRRELKNAARRKMAGVGVGVVSAVTIGMLSEHFGHWIHDKFAGHNVPSVPKGLAPQQPTTGVPVAGGGTDIIHPANNVVPQPKVLSGGSSMGEVPKMPNITPTDVPNVPSAVVPNIPHTTIPNIPSAILPVDAVEIASKAHNSVWKMAAEQLERHFGANVPGLDPEHAKMFANFSPEQKTYLIDAIQDRVASHHTELRIDNIDKIKLGQHIDFSKIFANNADISSVFEHAKNLTADQLNNIHHNNANIMHWVETHHGQALTSPKVEEILAHAQNHPGVTLDHPTATPAPAHTPAPTPQLEAIRTALEQEKLATALPVDSHIAPPIHGSSPVPNTFDHLPGTETIVADKVNNVNMAPLAMAGAGIGGIKIMNKKLADKNNVVKFPDAEKRAAMRLEKEALSAQKEFENMESEYKLTFGEKWPERATKLIRKITLSSGENWELMKVIKFSEWKKGSPIKIITEPGKEPGPKLTRNVKKLVDSMVKYSGGKAGPKQNETLIKWVARVAEDSTKAERMEDWEALKQAA